MGCNIDNSRTKETLDLTWASDAKGYNKDELNVLIEYIDQTTNWLTIIHANDDEDLLCYRIGTPTITSYDMSDTKELKAELNITNETYVLTSIELDAVKLTSKYKYNHLTPEVLPQKCANGFSCSYTYKSKYVHRILDNYYIDGVSNSTGWTIPAVMMPGLFGGDPIEVIPAIVHERLDYIDNAKYNLNLSATIGVPVVHDGVETIASATLPLPDFVYKCFQLICQNIGLLKDFAGADPQDKKGDLVYITIGRLKERLAIVRSNSVKKVSTFFPQYYEDIKYILEEVGMDQAFKDVQYGGLIDNLRLMIRIPASYENELALKNLIEDGEVAKYFNIAALDVTDTHRNTYFNYAFKEVVVGSSEDMYKSDSYNKHPRLDELEDIRRVQEAVARIKNNDYTNANEDVWKINRWYDTEYVSNKDSDLELIKNLTPPALNAIGATTNLKGCEKYALYSSTDGDGNTTEYEVREYRMFIPNVQWLANMDYSRVSIIFWMGIDLRATSENDPCPYDTIITIIIIIVVTYLTAGTATPEVAAALWASAIIQIGLVTGAFGDGEAARNAAIVATVLSLYGGYTSWAQAGGTSAATTESIKFAASVASASLSMVQTFETENFNEKMEDMQKEINANNEAAEMYESDIRFSYDGSYYLTDKYLRHDPYDDIREIYKPYASYKTRGFRN